MNFGNKDGAASTDADQSKAPSSEGVSAQEVEVAVEDEQDGEKEETIMAAEGVEHVMRLLGSGIEAANTGSEASSIPVVRVRELPITRADQPFASEESPEDDTTGLSVWPASIILSRWAAALGPNFFNNKVVVELGAGCGLPSLATALYCKPKSVFITDIHEPTLQNAQYNVQLNQPLGVTVDVKKVNWQDIDSYPTEKADVILGSDLVYDIKILDLLIPATVNMLAKGGSLLYVAPDTGRDGMVHLLEKLQEVGLTCVEKFPATSE